MIPIASGDGFSGWHALNDTVMGGRSQGNCRIASTGLEFDGTLIEEGGGFISCRSPLFSPPLDLSSCEGLEIELLGDGRRFKLAVACADGLAGLTNLIPGGPALGDRIRYGVRRPQPASDSFCGLTRLSACKTGGPPPAL